MKLAYKIPHKVTCRMVGVMFVATCSCKVWAAQVNPRLYDGMLSAWYDNGILPSPVADLLDKAHKHATDHVIDSHGFTRKVAS